MIEQIAEQIAGLRCSAATNPIGSILSLDFGPLGTPEDAPAGARPHGFRHLTISSPWRVQDASEVLYDWNVDGGTGGLLPDLVGELVGLRVGSVKTSPPSWDLRIEFDNGWALIVFGDCEDDRDEAWFIIGTDGVKAVARPRVRVLPHRAVAAEGVTNDPNGEAKTVLDTRP